MRTSLRVLAILAAAAAALTGATPPRSRAFAIDGATQWSVNGHWYRYFSTGTTPISWSASKAIAEGMGGYLATITSSEENSWVTGLIPGTGLTWLGGSVPTLKGAWVWMTGEPWVYSNWCSTPIQQPDGSGYYLATNYGVPGTWDDRQDGGVGPSRYVAGYVVEWGSGWSPPENPAPPAAPTELTGSVTYGNPISLSWMDRSDNEEAFEIERCTDGGGWTKVAELGPDCTLYEDVGTNPGTGYTYRVRAANAGGASDWSNEATATASMLAPGPRAPADLAVVACTTDSVELWWSDASVDEIGFEVHRRGPGGDYALVASLPPGSGGFTDTGLPPDTECEYGVRSLNAFRASGFCEVAAGTLPTLSVTATRADLKDSPRFGRDSLRVQALFDFLPESPDGLFDVLAEGIGLRVGPVDRPVVMSLPKNLDTWKVRGTKATWKSARGTTPKYFIQVDTAKRTVKATASGLELPEPPENPMRVSITVGNDGGTAKGDWETLKPGVFRLR